MIPIQAILLTLILILGIFFLGLSRRRSRLTGRIILVGFVLILSIFILFPDITTQIANLFGVGRGTDFLFYLFALFILYVISLMYIRLRDQDRKITKITRALAIRDALRSNGFPHSTEANDIVKIDSQMQSPNNHPAELSADTDQQLDQTQLQ